MLIKLACEMLVWLRPPSFVSTVTLKLLLIWPFLNFNFWRSVSIRNDLEMKSTFNSNVFLTSFYYSIIIVGCSELDGTAKPLQSSCFFAGVTTRAGGSFRTRPTPLRQNPQSQRRSDVMSARKPDHHDHRSPHQHTVTSHLTQPACGHYVMTSRALFPHHVCNPLSADVIY